MTWVHPSLNGARLRLCVAAVARTVGGVAAAEALLAQILALTTEPSPLRLDALVEAARSAACDPHAPQDQLAVRMSAAGKACVALGHDAELIGGAVLLGVSSEANRLRGHFGQAALVRALLDAYDVNAAEQVADVPRRRHRPLWTFQRNDAVAATVQTKMVPYDIASGRLRQRSDAERAFLARWSPA